MKVHRSAFRVGPAPLVIGPRSYQDDRIGLDCGAGILGSWAVYSHADAGRALLRPVDLVRLADHADTDAGLRCVHALGVEVNGPAVEIEGRVLDVERPA